MDKPRWFIYCTGFYYTSENAQHQEKVFMVEIKITFLVFGGPTLEDIFYLISFSGQAIVDYLLHRILLWQRTGAYSSVYLWKTFQLKG